jgi:hypothetical protein
MTRRARSKFSGLTWVVLDRQERREKVARMADVERQLREACADPVRRDRLAFLVGEAPLRQFCDDEIEREAA